MASGTLGSRRDPLRDLFVGGTAVGLSDGELLRRYAASQDGPAFEALVARHGPMVVATCRAVLHNHHDVEDAFQATFLVLARRSASIRAGETLGGWLHRVAYRAAVQLNTQAKRRRRNEAEASAMEIPDTTRTGLDFDVRSILHEEIDRLPDFERLPVVLCDLGGLTYEQAAGRLQWTVPTLYHRLAKGRNRLRERLIRRGVTAAAAGVATELSRASGTAAVPAAWVHAVVTAATGGPVPAALAALTHSLIRSLLMTRLKLASVFVLAAAALASVSVVAVGPGWPIASIPGPSSPARQASSTPAGDTKPAPKSPVRKPREDAPKRGALRIARLKHAGDWDLAPQAVPSLMDALRKPPFRFDVVLTQKDLSPRDPGLIYYPLIYIHGRGALSFPEEDLDALRRHLDRGGGTLFADAACGDPAFDAAFRHFVIDLLPDHKLEPIPRNDDLYTDKLGFDLHDCQYTKAAGGGRDFPQLEGVKVNGHWAILYSKLDLAHALERHPEDGCKGYTYDSAVRIGGNILIYSTFP